MQLKKKAYLVRAAELLQYRAKGCHNHNEHRSPTQQYDCNIRINCDFFSLYLL